MNGGRDTPSRLTWYALLLTAVCLPLSVKVFIPAIGVEIVFPAEILIAFATIIGAAAIVKCNARWFCMKIKATHPLTLAIGCYWIFLFVSTLFSTEPLISWKAFLVQTASIIVFFVVPTRRNLLERKHSRILLDSYSYCFLIIVCYTLMMQTNMGLDRASASYASMPFYIDHTIYGAALVYVLFWFGGAIIPSPTGSGRSTFYLLLVVSLVGAVMVSYTRAAWISVILSVFVGLILIGSRYRKHRNLLGIGILATMLSIGSMYNLLGNGNWANSTKHGSGFAESLRSIVNTKSDGSNLERIIRWRIAWEMFLDKPLVGHGFGTYQFAGQGYRESNDTLKNPNPSTQRISKVWAFGDLAVVRDNPQLLHNRTGTAHCEYLLALSETGLGGALSLLSIFCICITTAFRYAMPRKGPFNPQLFAIGSATVAYATHACVNNFLDDPKISFWFYMCCSFVVLDTTRKDSLHPPAN